MLLAERIARFGNKIVSLLTAILIILLLTYGLYSLWDIYRINHNAFISDELLKYKPGQENGLGFDALRELNPDVKAWKLSPYLIISVQLRLLLSPVAVILLLS